MEINYAVLMPPPKRSAKKLQMAILGGVGFVALTAIVVAIVLVKAYSPQAATLGPDGPTPSLAAALPAPAVTPTPVPDPTAKPAPAAADKDDKGTKPTKKRAGRTGRRVKASAGAGNGENGAPARPKKKADDELKKLLGI